ncbi:MAG: S24 family peptidase [Bryobacterales bacterium]|nr:S24 family peptidase [Bryobacterales bacterium]
MEPHGSTPQGWATERAREQSPVETTRAEFAILELHIPGEPGIPAGVLLLDPSENRLHVKMLERWPPSLEREDRVVLQAIAEDFASRAASEPGEQLLQEFESSFSHLLRLSARESVTLQKADRELKRLFERHVSGRGSAKSEAPAAIVPFRTHLPFYPMKIAAGLFDGDTEVDASAWVPLPQGLRPDEGLFVAQITGKSMEPRIPDGAYCLFRIHPQGSREGKLVLVQQFGSSDSGGAFTIKRYHSEKAPQRPPGDDEFGDAEWRHSRVRLISLNPLYPSWDLVEGECRIIAELVRVLDPGELPGELL